MQLYHLPFCLQFVLFLVIISSYLVSSLYEESASSASSILKWLSKHSEDLEAGDPFELYDMLESAGMVLVQSFKQLGSTSEILNELKLLFVSVPTIPVQLLLTGYSYLRLKLSLFGFFA
ncbi:unnamed protein product [Prunus armeniaca]